MALTNVTIKCAVEIVNEEAWERLVAAIEVVEEAAESAPWNTELQSAMKELKDIDRNFKVRTVGVER